MVNQFSSFSYLHTAPRMLLSGGVSSTYLAYLDLLLPASLKCCWTLSQSSAACLGAAPSVAGSRSVHLFLHTRIVRGLEIRVACCVSRAMSGRSGAAWGVRLGSGEVSRIAGVCGLRAGLAQSDGGVLPLGRSSTPAPTLCWSCCGCVLSRVRERRRKGCS